MNTNIFKYYYKNLLNIGENVPVADFGHYADYCAQLIPLSLLKSSLGGGGSAAHMWHCTKLPTQYYSTMVLEYCSSGLVDGFGDCLELHIITTTRLYIAVLNQAGWCGN